MVTRSRLLVILALGICATAAGPASAQQRPPGIGRDVVYESARNRIGLLRYCQRASLIDPASADIAIEVAERDLGDFTASIAPATRGHGDVAEQEGEDGILGPNSKRDIAAFARQFNTTPKNLCQEWAAESLRGQGGRTAQRIQPETIYVQGPASGYLPAESPKPQRRPAPIAIAAPPPQSLPPAVSAPPATYAPARSTPPVFESNLPYCPN